jgi:hypothetical protein
MLVLAWFIYQRILPAVCERKPYTSVAIQETGYKELVLDYLTKSGVRLEGWPLFQCSVKQFFWADNWLNILLECESCSVHFEIRLPKHFKVPLSVGQEVRFRYKNLPAMPSGGMQTLTLFDQGGLMFSVDNGWDGLVLNQDELGGIKISQQEAGCTQPWHHNAFLVFQFQNETLKLLHGSEGILGRYRCVAIRSTASNPEKMQHQVLDAPYSSTSYVIYRTE